MTLHLGKVKPGSTIYIPFDTFAGSTGASITMTGLATSDILIYKSGGTTQRASTTGFTLLDTDGIDFDGVTGIHGLSIDLSSNATADFYNAGAMYWVVISTITVDSQTVSFVLATFTIGYEGAILDTTIATLSSQTSFTLTAGPAEDDALNGCEVVIHDIASAVQAGRAFVSDYTGSTKTITLVAGTTFTAAAGDNISVFLSALQPTVQGRSLDVTATGGAGIDWANVENPTTALNLSGTNIDVDQVVASVSGAVGSVTGAVGSVTGNVGGNVTGSVGSVASGGITAASIATDAIDADALADGAITAATFAAGAITATVIADNAIDAATLAADVTTELQAGLATAAALADVQTDTDTIITTLGTPAGASISADIAAIEAQTDDIGVNGVGLTALASAANLATVASYIDTEIAAIQTTLQGLVLEQGTIGATGNTTTAVHLAGLTYGDDEINNYLLVIFDVSESEYHSRWIEDWANTGDLATVATLPFTPQASTDLFWLLPVRQDVTGGSGLDAAGVRAAIGLASANLDMQLAAIDDAVDTEVGTVLTRLGTPSDLGSGATVAANLVDIEGQTDDIGVAGAGLTALGDTRLANLNATVSSRASQTSLDTLDDFVDTEVGAILTRLGTPSDLGGGATVAANLADIEAQTDDIGTAGAGLTALGDTRIANLDATISSRATPAQVNTEADTALADVGLTTTVTGRVDAAISSRLATAGYTAPDNSSIAAILVDTGTDIPAQLNTIDDFLDTEVLAIKAKTDNLPASPAAVGSAMTLTSGERTAIATAHLTLDLSGVSGEAARSVLNALRALRNKVTVAGGTMTVFEEDDTTTAWTAAISTDAAAEPVVGVDPS